MIVAVKENFSNLKQNETPYFSLRLTDTRKLKSALRYFSVPHNSFILNLILKLNLDVHFKLDF